MAMAPTAVVKFIAMALLIAASVGTSKAKGGGRMKETKMVFYMQDWETGKNVTAVPVGGLNGTKSTVLNFATIFAIDDALTETIDRSSKQLGRAQGMYVNSALDGSDIHMLFSAIFTDEKYNGSTIEIQGADRGLHKYREVSVVSGTGMFRYARGYATIETAYLDTPNLNVILKFNLTILHF